MKNDSIIKAVADYKLVVSSLLLAAVPICFNISNKNKQNDHKQGLWTKSDDQSKETQDPSTNKSWRSDKTVIRLSHQNKIKK